MLQIYVSPNDMPVNAGMLGAMPELLTVKCFDKYMNAITSPPVIASCMVIAAIVPHAAVDAGNAMMFAFVPCAGFEPLGGGKFVVSFEYETRL